MKADTRCFPCLKRLAIQTAELATTDPKLRAKAMGEPLKILKRNFFTDIVPTSISDKMHARIKELTKTIDPYKELKKREMEIAKGMGHYETLSELPKRRRVFYLLMAKCTPVARSAGIPKGEYAAMLR